jgi:ammonia channel protein AmtB
MGIVMINVLTSFLVGGAVGTWLAYKKRQPAWILIGSLSSAILCGALFDIAKPWEVLLVSLFGPFVTLFGQRVMVSMGIDDPKVVPLALFNGIGAALVAGFVGWGTATGGFLGLEGAYGFQHAEITPWWQAIGVLAILAIAMIPAYIMAVIFERTSGLRVDDAGQAAGLDTTNWDSAPVRGVEPAAAGTAVLD